MSLEKELTEDALARRILQLDTLYELNQHLSTLRNVNEVLESALLNIMGVFGLRNGLIAIYRDDQKQPEDFASRGMQKKTAQRWFNELEKHLKKSYICEICVTQHGADSPMAELLSDHQFNIWLPLQINEKTWGSIVLGPKLIGADFTEDDIDYLSTIAINVQNILSNVILIEALNQAVIKETRIRNVFQRYAPDSVVNEVLDPSNEELLLGESRTVRRMFEQIISDLEEQYRFEQELDLARDVQQYLLPLAPPELPGIKIVAKSIPARGVCGDFFDFIPLGTTEIGISLADISGKGMSAAMIATMLQSATRMCVGSYYPIPATLSILNRFIFQHTDDLKYATMFYGQINTRDRSLTYSNAAHPPPMLCRDGELQMLETGGSVIGMFEHWSYDQDRIKLRSGDALVIYSDGVTDAGIDPEVDVPDVEYGQERLEAAVIANADSPADVILDAIANEVSEYAPDSKQFDDITLIVMKVE